jgi:hypothetical protein
MTPMRLAILALLLCCSTVGAQDITLVQPIVRPSDSTRWYQEKVAMRIQIDSLKREVEFYKVESEKWEKAWRSLLKKREKYYKGVR